jgi:V/A-type H+-transporting ATPase subunit I
MIVPMRKVTVLVLESARDRELARLKRLGVLHPDIEARTSEDAERILAERDLVAKAVAALPSEGGEEQGPVPGVRDELVVSGVETAARIVALRETARELTEQADKWRSELDRVRPWGEFEPGDLRDLEEKGIHIRLFSMNRKDYARRAPDRAVVISRAETDVLFALLGHGDDTEVADEVRDRPDAKELRLPAKSPAGLRETVSQIMAEIDQTQKQLEMETQHRELLVEAGRELDDRLDHERVRLGMDTGERVAYISGFVPGESEDSLRQAARNNGWGLLLRDPSPEDDVPTRISNPRWIRTIRPVFNLLGVIPGYRERDISMWFLLFFTVFVGMIIGDAGYGALLLVGAIYAIISSRRKHGRVGEGIVLLAVLSLSTLAWGAITGNWFGYEPIAQMRPFSLAVIPSFNSFDPRSTQSVQRVCFFLAVVHLSIARIWNFIREIRQKPVLKSFAQLGWLGIVVGLFFLVVSLFLGQEMPPYALYMIVGGIGFVFLFSGQSPETGFFAGIGKGLSNAFTIIGRGRSRRATEST